MVYFISDVHLGYWNREKDKQRETQLLKLMNEIKSDCETLVLLGDIFDYWFEYKQVIPKYFYRFLNILHEFKDSGIKIEYVMGNHDFGHIDFFKSEFDIDIYKTDIERIYNGKKFYLSHGDGKAYNDRGYLILRSILRNRFAQKVYMKLHPDFGIGLAAGSSRKSRNYTDSKNYGARDGMKDFAFSKIDSGFDFVIMGHRHKAEIIDYKNGKYINLGEWLRKPHYGVFDGNEFKLIKLDIEFA